MEYCRFYNAALEKKPVFDVVVSFQDAVKIVIASVAVAYGP